MSKYFLIVSMMFATASVFSNVTSSPNPTPGPNISGNWIYSSERCEDGSRVIQPFEPAAGFELSMRATTKDNLSGIWNTNFDYKNCQHMEIGHFEINGEDITYFVDADASCQGAIGNSKWEMTLGEVTQSTFEFKYKSKKVCKNNVYYIRTFARRNK